MAEKRLDAHRFNEGWLNDGVRLLRPSRLGCSTANYGENEKRHLPLSWHALVPEDEQGKYMSECEAIKDGTKTFGRIAPERGQEKRILAESPEL
jgi:hypothetical protein